VITESPLAPIPFNPSTFSSFSPDFDTALTPFFDFLEPLGFDIEDGTEENRTRFMAFIIRDLVQAKLPEVNVVVGIKDFPNPSPANSAEILIGGTVEESGFFTIGLAQSIDVGNFAPSQKAFVLMDFLTGYGFFFENDDFPFNLPFYDNESTLLWAASADDDQEQINHDIAYTRLVATTIANIVVHEAGHFLGNFHTENVVTPLNIMDAGGTGIPILAGFGNDGRFNTSDDINVPLGPDLYDPSEGFIGVEDTDLTIFYGVGGLNPTPINFANLFVNFATANNGIGTPNFPFNALQAAIDIIDDGGTINITPSSGSEVFSGSNRIDLPMTLVNEDPEGEAIRIGGEASPLYLRTIR
jgi:hypothetical protein